MSKLKQPILSLGARGTIADTLTYQKRGQDTIVREKPIPRDPYSLNQAYQRWDYRDYAYLWTLLTNSEKQVYRTEASRYHITGYSLWMRKRLKELTDLAGRWHLDEKSGAVAHDSSKQGNNGIITGATPVPGTIAGAFYFDGLNDFVDFGSSSSLQSFTAFTAALFITPNAFTGATRGILQGGYRLAPFGFQMYAHATTNVLRFFFKNTLGAATLAFFVYTPDATIHLAVSWDGSFIQRYINGLPYLVPLPFTGVLDCSSVPLYLGFITGRTYCELTADELIIDRRALDATEILRLSERRYPA